MSANDSDRALTNDDDDDINCDHRSSKNLTFSSYFYKALLDHDGGKCITKLTLIQLNFAFLRFNINDRFFQSTFFQTNIFQKESCLLIKLTISI